MHGIHQSKLWGLQSSKGKAPYFQNLKYQTSHTWFECWRILYVTNVWLKHKILGYMLLNAMKIWMPSFFSALAKTCCTISWFLHADTNILKTKESGRKMARAPRSWFSCSWILPTTKNAYVKRAWGLEPLRARLGPMTTMTTVCENINHNTSYITYVSFSTL